MITIAMMEFLGVGGIDTPIAVGELMVILGAIVIINQFRMIGVLKKINNNQNKMIEGHTTQQQEQVVQQPQQQYQNNYTQY